MSYFSDNNISEKNILNSSKPLISIPVSTKNRISAQELHKYVLGLVGIFILCLTTYPIAIYRVSQHEKFVSYRSHLKSLTPEYKSIEPQPVVSAVTTIPAQVLLSSSSKTIKLQNSTTGAAKNTLTGNTDRLYSVRFSTNGKKIASSRVDGSIKRWNLNMGKLNPSIESRTTLLPRVNFDRYAVAGANTNQQKLDYLSYSQLLSK